MSKRAAMFAIETACSEMNKAARNLSRETVLSSLVSETSAWHRRSSATPAKPRRKQAQRHESSDDAERPTQSGFEIHEHENSEEECAPQAQREFQEWVAQPCTQF